MSWNVEVRDGRCIVTVRSAYDGRSVSWDGDAANLRILIDALHCALDILKPDWAPTPKEME